MEGSCRQGSICKSEGFKGCQCCKVCKQSCCECQGGYSCKGEGSCTSKEDTSVGQKRREDCKEATQRRHSKVCHSHQTAQLEKIMGLKGHDFEKVKAKVSSPKKSTGC